MDAIEALRTRRSVRAYSLKSVSNEVLEELVDCARLAPSGRNVQPCEFVVVNDSNLLRDLADSCEFGSFIADAAACVAVLAREDGHWLQDAACAATCLMVAARAHEIGSCWVQVHGKDNEEEVRELLDVPKDVHAICLISLGYGEAPPPPPKKDLESVLHWGRYSAD